MKHALQFSFAVIAVLMAAVSVFTQEQDPGLIKVYLKMDKASFYQDEDIALRICIKNKGDENALLDIYEKKDDMNSLYITFQPVVFDMKGREAETIVPYRLENKDPKSMIKEFIKRTIQIGPHEEIIRVVNLKQVYNLQAGTRYRVKGFVFPSFEKDVVIQSDNELSFRIFGKKMSDIKSGIVQKYQRKSDTPEMLPSEVIYLVLNAEKTKSLHRFIKYFNIEKYINAYPNFVRKYNRAFDEKKSKIEDEFITFLYREREDYIVDFKIKREDIDRANNAAYVEAYVERYAPRQPFRYLYRYTLEKSLVQNVHAWLITNLDAIVVKGEIK